MYLQRRILEEVYGKARAEMDTMIGLQKPRQAMVAPRIIPEDRHLKLALKDRDPEDSSTEIAYEKGYFFLRTLETNIGRPEWDKFLREYFDHHAFASMSTETFLAYLDEKILSKHPGLKPKLEIDAWVYGATLPD